MIALGSVPTIEPAMLMCALSCTCWEGWGHLSSEPGSPSQRQVLVLSVLSFAEATHGFASQGNLASHVVGLGRWCSAPGLPAVLRWLYAL